MADYVLQILENYLAWEVVKQQKNYPILTQKEKDKLRLQYDNDAKYYYEVIGLAAEKALYADTIISFWTPYSRLLKIEAGWTAYKSIRSLESLIRQIKTTRNNNYTEKIRGVNKNIEAFAQLCYTKGNYMLLPKRQMNTCRYRVAEDRIDLTLYECFEKGALAKFFKNEKELNKWIKNQNLNTVFNGDIDKESIDWFVTEDKPKRISEMNNHEVYEYIESSILLIQSRNSNIPI